MAAKTALEIQTKKSFWQEAPRGCQRAAEASQLAFVQQRRRVLGISPLQNDEPTLNPWVKAGATMVEYC
jgi:hypothetical protein